MTECRNKSVPVNRVYKACAKTPIKIHVHLGMGEWDNVKMVCLFKGKMSLGLFKVPRWPIIMLGLRKLSGAKVEEPIRHEIVEPSLKIWKVTLAICMYTCKEQIYHMWLSNIIQYHLISYVIIYSDVEPGAWALNCFSSDTETIEGCLLKRDVTGFQRFQPFSSLPG